MQYQIKHYVKNNNHNNLIVSALNGEEKHCFCSNLFLLHLKLKKYSTIGEVLLLKERGKNKLVFIIQKRIIKESR